MLHVTRIIYFAYTHYRVVRGLSGIYLAFLIKVDLFF